MLTSKIETFHIDNNSWLAVYQVNETGIIYEIGGETEEDAIHNLLTSLAIDYLASEFSDAQWYNTCQDFGSQFQAYLRSWYNTCQDFDSQFQAYLRSWNG